MSNKSLKYIINTLSAVFKHLDPFKLIDIPKYDIIKYIPIPTNIVLVLIHYLTGLDKNMIDFDSTRTKLLVETFGWTSSYNLILWTQRETWDIKMFDLNATWNMEK